MPLPAPGSVAPDHETDTVLSVVQLPSGGIPVTEKGGVGGVASSQKAALDADPVAQLPALSLAFTAKYQFFPSAGMVVFTQLPCVSSTRSGTPKIDWVQV